MFGHANFCLLPPMSHVTVSNESRTWWTELWPRNFGLKSAPFKFFYISYFPSFPGDPNKKLRSWTIFITKSEQLCFTVTLRGFLKRFLNFKCNLSELLGLHLHKILKPILQMRSPPVEKILGTIYLLFTLFFFFFA